MTTLTNSKGNSLTYTNYCIETILLELNSSDSYYTSGNDDIIFLEIGSTKALLLYYTYHIHSSRHAPWRGGPGRGERGRRAR